jgi:hypothetical protein
MVSDSLSNDLLACGLVDTHFHVGPELLDRRYDVSTLAETARRCRMTLVLKVEHASQRGDLSEFPFQRVTKEANQTLEPTR